MAGVLLDPVLARAVRAAEEVDPAMPVGLQALTMDVSSLFVDTTI